VNTASSLSTSLSKLCQSRIILCTFVCPLQLGISHLIYQQLIEIFNLRLMLMQLHLLPPLVLL
jgi:hypothetical protein